MVKILVMEDHKKGLIVICLYHLNNSYTTIYTQKSSVHLSKQHLHAQLQRAGSHCYHLRLPLLSTKVPEFCGPSSMRCLTFR